MNLNRQILHNLTIERERCIAKLYELADRFVQLEGQISEQKKIVDKETEEKKL